METKRAKTWMGMAVALAAMAVGSAAWGETEIVGNVEWTYWADSGEATVESANPAKGALTVPSSLGGLTVTGIAGWSFGYCETLTSVAIPNSVTSVGESVFEGCGRLQVLEVPASWQGTDMLAYAGVPDGCEVEYRRGDVLAVETAALPGATEGKPYEAALTASGGTPPYTWSCPPGSYSEKAEMGSFEETGDKQGWADDDACWELALPFAFPFFGREYGTCYVSDNGTIAFDGRFSQYSYNEDKFLSHPMLAAMWADLGGEKMDIAVDMQYFAAQGVRAGNPKAKVASFAPALSTPGLGGDMPDFPKRFADTNVYAAVDITAPFDIKTLFGKGDC